MHDNYKHSSTTEQITLKDIFLKVQEFWAYILSKWLIIILAGIAGALVGLVYAFNQKAVYQAELSFVLDEETSAGGANAYGSLASQFGINLLGGGNGGGAFVGDNLFGLMKSRFMMEKTLLTPVEINGKRQTLAAFYINVNKLVDDGSALADIKFLPGADRSSFSRKQDSVLGSFYKKLINKDLTVEKNDKKSGFNSVKVKSTDEIFAKLFAETLVKEVTDFYIDSKTRKSSRNLSILQRQTDSVRRELNAAMSGVASSIEANPNANPALQTLKLPSQRRQVDAQANQAMFSELVKNLETAKVALRRETPLIQIIDYPILPLEKVQLGKFKSAIIGAFLFDFLIIMGLLGKKVIQDTLKS
ncbi:MAG: lipopolysaccharide biosynthesis protein [Sphingobacteriaceae bacterium]